MTSDHAAAMAMAGVASTRALRPGFAWPGTAGGSYPAAAQVRTACLTNHFSITGRRPLEEVST